MRGLTILVCLLLSGAVPAPPSSRSQRVLVVFTGGSRSFQGLWYQRIYPNSRVCARTLGGPGLETLGRLTIYVIRTCIPEGQ